MCYYKWNMEINWSIDLLTFCGGYDEKWIIVRSAMVGSAWCWWKSCQLVGKRWTKAAVLFLSHIMMAGPGVIQTMSSHANGRARK